MDTSMMKILKSKNPNEEYPSNLGKKWTDNEERLLLAELNNNIDIEIIAQNHNRTKGSIYSRRNHIAYKMYLENIPMEEIIEKTKLDEQRIKEIIEKKQNYTPKRIIEPTKSFSIEGEFAKLNNEIKDLRNTIKEMAEMIKAIYDIKNV